MVEAIGTVEAAVMTALIAVGVLFLAIGTIGLLRFPNVYNRMHATSKPTTLGTAAIFTAAFVRFGPGGDGLPSLLGIAFLFLTVPTGAHMIARSAERMGVPFEEGVTWPAPPEVEAEVDDAATEGETSTDGDGTRPADESDESSGD
ncbi:monovalent cation/H(+) antiporter subunit G [Natronomonas salina]|uniref:monovalent cation/H(+) antiporter subunit G n=1 Tax=Natronomonas salina TaxID=1710540 RepID=UPI0015B6570B|nr:monovalent cation/H(+) antiporter subunit G [Natronomonas salina]